MARQLEAISGAMRGPAPWVGATVAAASIGVVWSWHGPQAALTAAVGVLATLAATRLLGRFLGARAHAARRTSIADQAARALLASSAPCVEDELARRLDLSPDELGEALAASIRAGVITVELAEDGTLEYSANHEGADRWQA